ncbi:hypothetical protein V6N13_070346 [Hibiscus sabdariffa]|uniref:Uncharacterized protein n=1 Tax=Hibiscus sabdariffa TaxID=183260 RepID=A0ABR2TGP1_9ROSI
MHRNGVAEAPPLTETEPIPLPVILDIASQTGFYGKGFFGIKSFGYLRCVHVKVRSEHWGMARVTKQMFSQTPAEILGHMISRNKGYSAN